VKRPFELRESSNFVESGPRRPEVSEHYIGRPWIDILSGAISIVKRCRKSSRYPQHLGGLGAGDELCFMIRPVGVGVARCLAWRLGRRRIALFYPIILILIKPFGFVSYWNYLYCELFWSAVVDCRRIHGHRKRYLELE
jgi:hypothetical protein